MACGPLREAVSACFYILALAGCPVLSQEEDVIKESARFLRRHWRRLLRRFGNIFSCGCFYRVGTCGRRGVLSALLGTHVGRPLQVKDHSYLRLLGC